MLADLAIQSEAATAAALRVASSYDDQPGPQEGLERLRAGAGWHGAFHDGS